MLRARNFFQVGEKPKHILNIDGGTLGGPIKKDKLFFFGGCGRARASAPDFSGAIRSRRPISARATSALTIEDLRPEHRQCGRQRAAAVRRQYRTPRSPERDYA